MEKKIIIAIFVTLFIFGWVFAWFYVKNQDDNEKSGTWTTDLTASWDTVDLEDEIDNDEEIVIDKNQSKKDKMNSLRKKLALRWLILKWDVNLQNQEYTSALIEYLKILKEIPGDKSIIKKIWDAYFSLQKFKQAYSYYSKIKDYEQLDKDRVVRTLLSFTAINDKNTPYINKQLEALWLSEEQLFYYKTSITCKKDFSLCKKTFQDYFNARKGQKNTWSWSADNTIKFKELYNIEAALTNYDNFQVDDLFYKWALVSWAFFENWLYPIAVSTAKKLLEERPDYKPLLKLIAKSDYELWNFIWAKLNLIEYNKLEAKDPEASYFLWVVYEKLYEYVLSTIHLNKALELWYKDRLDVYKRILFNYFELWDMSSMLRTFKTIIKNNKEELTVNDYSLAIYYHIVSNKTADAKNFTKLGLKKFPESEILNWYMWWILMEEVNNKSTKSNFIVDIENKKNLYLEAEKYIDKWLKIDWKNPMLTLVKWKLEVSKWDSNKAIMYFNKTLNLDAEWDFWKIAKQELEKIKKQEWEVVEKIVK